MMLSNDKDLAISHEDELATFFLLKENSLLERIEYLLSRPNVN